MPAIRVIPIVLSAALVAAHFFRIGNLGMVGVSVFAPFLLLIRRAWIPLIAKAMLLAGAVIWLSTAWDLTRLRSAIGAPWLRMALILGGVAAFTALSTLVFQFTKLKERYAADSKPPYPSAIAFGLTALALSMVRLKVEIPMLLADRLWPGAGWMEIFGLSVWAAWIVDGMLDPKKSASLRRRIWLAFSLVFFGQLALGLFVSETFLLTGKLHIPVPALIAAGPIFRGEGFFMPILFSATLLLVGPAWCSHLCYIGAWDHSASESRRRPKALPTWTRSVRVGILAFAVAAAIALRFAGASTTVAGAVAIGFGLLGVAVMAVFSRKTGAMVHCSVYCPMGLIADLLGKLSPFRVRLSGGCTQCGKCSLACRYDALSKNDIEKKRPGLNCTLCGDCIGMCKERQIEYTFGRLRGDGVRAAFIVLISSLHAVFMGLARI